MNSSFRDKLKKREQYYLIEKEIDRLNGHSETMVGGSTKNAYSGLLHKFPGIDYNNKGIRKIIKHIFAQLEDLDAPLVDAELSKIVEEYLSVLQTNSQVQCNNYAYVPVGILPQPKKLVIIGDLHADYCVTLACLKLGGIIDDNVTKDTPTNKIECKKTLPPDTIVVQLGDQIDGDGRSVGKWDEPDCQSFIKIHQLFDHLNRTKKVLILAVYGNHELMNLNSNFKYKPGGYLSLREAEEIKKYGIEQLKQDLVCTRRPFWIVGDWLMVHGGITDSWFETFDGIIANKKNPELSSEMSNRVLQNYYTTPGGSGDHDSLTRKVLSTLEDGHTHGPNPTWNRSYARNGSCHNVPKLLRGIIKNIAISHTVQEGYEITSTNCAAVGTTVYRLDTGMSAAFGRLGKPQVLVQENGGKPKVIV